MVARLFFCKTNPKGNCYCYIVLLIFAIVFFANWYMQIVKKKLAKKGQKKTNVLDRSSDFVWPSVGVKNCFK